MEGTEVWLHHKMLVGAVGGKSWPWEPGNSQVQQSPRKGVKTVDPRGDQSSGGRLEDRESSGDEATRCLDQMEHKVVWNDLWKMHPHSIKFLLQAVYDIFPSSSSLHC